MANASTPKIIIRITTIIRYNRILYRCQSSIINRNRSPISCTIFKQCAIDDLHNEQAIGLDCATIALISIVICIFEWLIIC